jgi:hypothetical protein
MGWYINVILLYDFLGIAPIDFHLIIMRSTNPSIMMKLKGLIPIVPIIEMETFPQHIFYIYIYNYVNI